MTFFLSLVVSGETGGFLTVKSHCKPLFVLQLKCLLYIASLVDVEFIVLGS